MAVEYTRRRRILLSLIGVIKGRSTKEEEEDQPSLLAVIKETEKNEE